MAAVVHVSAVGGFVRSTCSEVWKVILPDTQSISGLWQVSQLCLRTTEQEGSREVTYKYTENRLFKGKWIGSSTASVIMELVLLSKSLSGMGLME